MENLSQKIDFLIPIIKERELKCKSYFMGFHEYRKIWKPEFIEILEVNLESANEMKKFTIAVIKNKNKKIIEHLPLGETGRFSKTIFY